MMYSSEFQSDKIQDWPHLSREGRRKILWVGTLSFEKRCVGSMFKLIESGVGITDAIIINYPTKAYPEEEDKTRRNDNLHLIRQISKDKGINLLETIVIEPYAFQSIQVALINSIDTYTPDYIIFDITCLTKIHTMALAALLTKLENGPGWSIVYTSPENYGNLTSQDQGFGWRDVIIAPLDDTALLYNEGHSRGIIVLGHESDRLIVALSEVEPSGGVFISAQTKNRPDLRLIAENKNRKIINQMLKMGLSDWTREAVNSYAPASILQIVNQEVKIAVKYNAPILFFPFGPKPIIFTIAKRLCENCSKSSWFIYPLPSAYDVNYTEGIGATSWFHKREFLSDLVALKQ